MPPNRYRESLQHDIRDKLQKTKEWDRVEIDSPIIDYKKRTYLVDVLAVHDESKRVRVYFVETAETAKYVDKMKHKAIEMQQAFLESDFEKYFFEFYFVTPRGTKKYNPAN